MNIVIHIYIYREREIERERERRVARRPRPRRRLAAGRPRPRSLVIGITNKTRWETLPSFEGRTVLRGCSFPPPSKR